MLHRLFEKTSAPPRRAGGRFLPVFGACALLALAGCSDRVVQHGNVVTAEELAAVQPGDTREQVLQRLGSPSTTSTFDETRWYYVSQSTEVRSFFQSDVTRQDVTEIVFDGAGRVARVSAHGLEQARAIDPSGESTRTLGNELGLMEQVIGNIGRFPTEGGGPASQR